MPESSLESELNELAMKQMLEENHSRISELFEPDAPARIPLLLNPAGHQHFGGQVVPYDAYHQEILDTVLDTYEAQTSRAIENSSEQLDIIYTARFVSKAAGFVTKQFILVERHWFSDHVPSRMALNALPPES